MQTIISFKDIEEFETKRLLAKKIQLKDYDLILDMYQNPTVMQNLGGVVPDNIAKERFLRSLANWEQNGFDAWLWFEKSSDRFIGRAGLRVLELEGEKAIEIGYALLPDYWNKGFATEIAMAAVEIAFEVLKLKQLVCFASITNQPSLRVMEKAGFKYERNFIYLSEEHRLYRLNSDDTH